MSDNDAPRFDPRFDPAFQRGFEGAGAQQNAGARAVAPDRPVVESVAPINDSIPDAAAVPTPAAVARADFQLDDEDAVPAGFRRRPSALLVVLLAIAAGLLAASVWLYAMLRDSFAEPAALSSPGDYYVMQSLQLLAPMLATLGLATAIGVIFVYAVRSK